MKSNVTNIFVRVSVVTRRRRISARAGPATVSPGTRSRRRSYSFRRESSNGDVVDVHGNGTRRDRTRKNHVFVRFVNTFRSDGGPLNDGFELKLYRILFVLVISENKFCVKYKKKKFHIAKLFQNNALSRM